MRATHGVLALLLVACHSKSTEPDPPPRTAGIEAWSALLPKLSADRLDARFMVETASVSLRALLPKKPTAVPFFATYCPPCIEEIPIFEQLRSEGYEVLGVSLDTGNLAGLKVLLDDQEVGYPVAVLTTDALKSAGPALDGLPLTLIFDANHQVRELYSGKVTRAPVLAALRRYQ